MTVSVYGGATKAQANQLLPQSKKNRYFRPNDSLVFAFRTVKTENDFPRLGIALQPDGKIIIIGSAKLPGSSLNGLAVLRFNPAGTPDATFGANGKQPTPIGANYSFGLAVALHADGKILTSGRTFVAPGGIGDAVIVRYSGDSVTPHAAKFDFDGDGKAD